MASNMEHTVHFRFPTESLYTAFAARSYWDDRIAQVGGNGADLTEFVSGDAGIDVILRQFLSSDDLPPVARKLFKDGLDITRTFNLGPLAHSTSGTYSASIPVGMGHVSGVQEIYPSAGGCSWKQHTEATVTVPFVGRKLEEALLENLQRIFEAETTFTADWVTRNL